MCLVYAVDFGMIFGRAGGGVRVVVRVGSHVAPSARSASLINDHVSASAHLSSHSPLTPPAFAIPCCAFGPFCRFNPPPGFYFGSVAMAKGVFGALKGVDAFGKVRVLSDSFSTLLLSGCADNGRC
jgi:hypothetical protein